MVIHLVDGTYDNTSSDMKRLPESGNVIVTGAASRSKTLGTESLNAAAAAAIALFEGGDRIGASSGSPPGARGYRNAPPVGNALLDDGMSAD